MRKPSLSRRLIFKEYASLIQSGEYKKVNVVRAIATKIGYTLDQNNSSSFVREVVNELDGKIAD